MTVEAHRAAGNRGILGELRLPEGIPDHGRGRTAAGAIVRGGEDPASNCTSAQDAEEVSADEESFCVSRLPFGDEVERVGAPGNYIGKRLLVTSDTFPISRSERGAAGGPPAASA
jgi:hypothetical protein